MLMFVLPGNVGRWSVLQLLSFRHTIDAFTGSIMAQMMVMVTVNEEDERGKERQRTIHTEVKSLWLLSLFLFVFRCRGFVCRGIFCWEPVRKGFFSVTVSLPVLWVAQGFTRSDLPDLQLSNNKQARRTWQACCHKRGTTRGGALSQLCSTSSTSFITCLYTQNPSNTVYHQPAANEFEHLWPLVPQVYNNGSCVQARSGRWAAVI